ncbi:hypothetical protein [Shimia sp. SDUM112013]|uniref:hypothetical protein n=1 Tax=Shimia sp. SDUM112013 TaxID=3136160 RepID=UPI0032EAF540
MSKTVKSYSVAILTGTAAGLAAHWALDLPIWAYSAVGGGVAGLMIGVMNRWLSEDRVDND